MTGEAWKEGDRWLPSLGGAPVAASLSVALPEKSPKPDDRARPQTGGGVPTSGPAPATGDEAGAESATVGAAADERKALIAIPTDRYYKPDELSVRPQPTEEIPDSIDRLWPQDLPGRAVITLYISENGAVDKLEVDESNVPSDFVTLATEAFRNSEFTPGQRDGRSVKSQITIELIFERAAY